MKYVGINGLQPNYTTLVSNRDNLVVINRSTHDKLVCIDEIGLTLYKDDTEAARAQ